MSFEEAEKVYLEHYRKLGYAIAKVPLPPIEDKKYTLREAAKRMNLSYSQLNVLRRSGKLVYNKPKKGNPVIFESYIQKYYAEGHINRSNAELEADAETFIITGEVR